MLKGAQPTMTFNPNHRKNDNAIISVINDILDSFKTQYLAYVGISLTGRVAHMQETWCREEEGQQ